MGTAQDQTSLGSGVIARFNEGRHGERGNSSCANAACFESGKTVV